MIFKTVSCFALLAGLSAAQTPDGFLPKVQAHLDVIYGTTAVTPGMSIAKAGEFVLSAAQEPAFFSR
jgi:hypothetical protein